VYQCTNYLGVETSWDLGDQSVGHQLVGHVSRTCHSRNTSAGHVTAATTPFTPPIFLYSGTLRTGYNLLTLPGECVEINIVYGES